ncbi:PREDICTED: uncharacterized protein LOC109590898, partial [Amphimedon queenslandica]|uniref:Uncharacterized protein n=2 Tax=Amphimedon queenslandica TaxID=400682 RepID=A0AAN0JYJ9_AMPQE
YHFKFYHAVKKLQEEKNELGQQYAAKIDVLEEVQKEERDTLTLKLSQLEIGLREIETQWKEKYRGDIELEQQELYDENQMLKLSVAEKETELLQSQDALLELRQCLAHMLIGLKLSSETDWLMISQKDVSTIQAIVNTGHCNDKDEEEKDAHSLTPDQASSSSGDCTNTQSCSGWTTSTEVGFRHDLAALDADIARLQIQFNVAQDLYH